MTSPARSLATGALVLLFASAFASALQAQTTSEAVALEQRGELAKAAQAWRAVVAHNPNDAAAFASLGVVLSKLQKYAEAASAYRKALALNPKLPGIELNLGLAEFKQGDFAAAVPAFRAAHVEPTTALRCE